MDSRVLLLGLSVSQSLSEMGEFRNGICMIDRSSDQTASVAARDRLEDDDTGCGFRTMFLWVTAARLQIDGSVPVPAKYHPLDSSAPNSVGD